MLRDDLLPARDIADDVADRGRAQQPYEHLEPVMAAYAATEPGDARRAELREQLILGYLPLARHIARRHGRRGDSLDDLEQVATIGLLGAVDRFRPEYGSPFLAFAVPTITGEVLRYFRDRSWSMRVPRRYKDLHVAINKVVVELSQQLNRAPRPSDIATALGIPVEEVLEGLQASQVYNTQSLDEPLGAGASRLDTIGDADAGFDRFIASHALTPYLAELPARERAILRMRFYDDLTQTQIAARLGLSQMHISRLLSATLAHLRQAVDQDRLPERSRTAGREPNR